MKNVSGWSGGEKSLILARCPDSIQGCIKMKINLNKKKRKCKDSQNNLICFHWIKQNCPPPTPVSIWNNPLWFHISTLRNPHSYFIRAHTLQILGQFNIFINYFLDIILFYTITFQWVKIYFWLALMNDLRTGKIHGHQI